MAGWVASVVTFCSLMTPRRTGSVPASVPAPFVGRACRGHAPEVARQLNWGLGQPFFADETPLSESPRTEAPRRRTTNWPFDSLDYLATLVIKGSSHLKGRTPRQGPQERTTGPKRHAAGERASQRSGEALYAVVLVRWLLAKTGIP